MALVMPTSQITVASRLRLSGKLIAPAELVSQGRSIAPMRTPCVQITAETATCPANRGHGDKANRSSASPIKKKQRDPANVLQIS